MAVTITPQVFGNYDPATGIGDPSTPLSKAFLDAWAVRLAADVTAGLADQAASDAAKYAPLSLTGTYAARPAANTVPAGTMFFPVDIPEQYRSDGAAWAVTGSGGNEVGYAQSSIVTAVSGATPVDLAGVTVTFKAGERPVLISAEAFGRVRDVGSILWMYVVLDGVSKGAGSMSLAAYGSFSRSVRVSGLTPGTTHTAKVQVAIPAAAGTGIGDIFGAADNVASIRVGTV